MTDVLDHGEVILVDSMANDWKVVDAARISTGKFVANALFDKDGNWREWADKDTRLINYLMSNGHGTPFEHAVFQFYVKCPIFVAREWQRHRIASYNEFSMRYAEVTEEAAEFYIPKRARRPDPTNKQSSVVWEERNVDELTPLSTGEEIIRNLIQQEVIGSMRSYQALIESGVAREMARMVLPVNIYTRFWFTVNARSLMNFLMLRNSRAAQWEIQQFAIALEDIFQEKMPVTAEAFVNNGRRAP